MPCTPEEMRHLAELLAKGKLGETEALSMDLPAPTQNPAVAETYRKMGLLAPGRTQRAAMGDHMAVNAVDPLTRINIKSENFIAKEFKEWKEAVKPLMKQNATWWNRITRTVPEETDIQLGQLLEQLERGGKYTGAPGAFTPEVMAVGIKLRAIYDRLFDTYVVDPDKYLKGYRPLIKQQTGGIFWRTSDEYPLEATFKRSLKPEDIIFYHELERKGVLLDPDPKASTGFISYINGLARAKILRPEIERLEKEVVNPHYGFKIYESPDGTRIPVADDAVAYSMWKETVHHMFGGPTPMDRKLTNSLQTMTRMMGFESDTRSLYRLSQGTSSLYHSGALGWRPASVIRQATQIVPTYAVLGAKYTMIGFQKAFEQDSIKDLIAKNVLSSPIENLIDAVGTQKMIGRAISTYSETSLKVFGAADRMTRAVTYRGAEAAFDDHLASGTIRKLPTIHKELVDEVDRLVSQNHIDRAREVYAFGTVADLQYSFGRANRPEVFRGALGNLAGMFLSYPLNTFEMVRMMGKTALPEKMGGSGNPMPLLRLIFVNAAIVGAGSEFLNADLRSMTLFNALPSSMAFPKTVLDTWNMGRTNAEWLTGSLFGIGETDFHKYKRIEDNKAVARDLRPFAPGGLFVWEDLWRAVDEGSLARMLALTPKAAAINEQNRLNQKERMAETGGMGLPKLRRLD